MPSKIKKEDVLIYGAGGRMGLALCHLLDSHPQLKLGASVDKDEIKAYDQKHVAAFKPSPASLDAVLSGVDIVVDFSTPAATKSLLQALKRCKKKNVLIGTTGLDEKIRSELRKVAKAGDHKILIAGNTSAGVFMLAKLAASAAKSLAPKGFDIEITETHHRMKLDAPSGTAIFLANVIQRTLPNSEIEFNRHGQRKKNSIGIQSVRGGGVFGEHEIRLISDDEEVNISHRAFSRTLFARGALNLAMEIAGTIPAGKALDLSELVNEKS